MRRRRYQLSKANSHRNNSQKDSDSLAPSSLASHQKKADLIQNDFPMITCESHTNRSRSDRALNYVQPYLAFISAWICSNGIPRPGFFSASSARRSSSAACSGVSSQSYPFSMMFVQTCWASSRRSRRLNLASISIFKVFQGNFPFGIGGAFQSWKPSMNSSQRRCASSTRSSNGSSFAAEKNFFTDMDSFYSDSCRAQFEIRHSPFGVFP